MAGKSDSDKIDHDDSSNDMEADKIDHDDSSNEADPNFEPHRTGPTPIG
jgi:hypothetical protein